jgi:hypothetical protein
MTTKLPPHGELDGELSRGARPPTKGDLRGSKRRHDVVGVRHIAGVGIDGPPAMAGAVLRAHAEQAVRTLSLNGVVERGVEHGRLPRRIGREGQSARGTNGAGPLDPEAAAPFRRVFSNSIPRIVTLAALRMS